MHYEVRYLDDPRSMPLGNGVLSKHATVDDAQHAVAVEASDYHASTHYTRGSFLSRAIIRVNDDGSQDRVY